MYRLYQFIFKKTLLFVSDLFFIAFAVLFLTNAFYNIKTAAGYKDNGVKGPYKQGVPPEDIELRLYEAYLARPTAPIGRPNITVKLPYSLRYYANPDSSTVVYEVPKGTEIVIQSYVDNMGGYGSYSYPTQKRGWRYAKPLTPETTVANLRKLPLYYIKTKDLEGVFREAYRTNNVRAYTGSVYFTERSFAFMMVRMFDQILYDKGTFNSPDLYRNLLGLRESILMVIALVLLALFIFINKKQRRV